MGIEFTEEGILQNKLTHTSTKTQISVVIPVYNAGLCLAELRHRLVKSLEELEISFEIIFIEDGGEDDSWEQITEFCKSDNRIIGAKLSKNFGQHNAITAGLEMANGFWTVVMDCDLQDRPEDIRILLEKAKEGFDLVVAKNANFRGRLAARRFFARTYYTLFTILSGYKLEEGVRTFRVLSIDVKRAVLSMREQMRFLGPLSAWVGFKTATVEVSTDKRFSGKSSYDIKKLSRLAIASIVAFSDRPLRISIIFGGILSGLSVLAGVVVAFRALNGEIQVEGWASVMLAIFFVGGLVIANLGILGIYIGKIFEEVKSRPLYLFAEKTSGDKNRRESNL